MSRRISDKELDRVIELLDDKSKANIKPYFVSGGYGLETKEGHRFNSTLGTTKAQLYDQIMFLLDWLSNEKKVKKALKEASKIE